MLGASFEAWIRHLFRKNWIVHNFTFLAVTLISLNLISKKVTLYDFRSLSDFEQAEAVWNGTLLAHREDGFFRTLLYQVDSFYVEVYYHKEANVLLQFRSFTTTSLLDPYLGQIDLTGKF
jgi:hypothetical protein